MAKPNSVDLLKVKMSRINIFPLHLHFLRKILNHMYFLQQFEVLLFLYQKTPISAFYMLLEHPDSVNILMLALHHHKNILYYYHSGLISRRQYRLWFLYRGTINLSSSRSQDLFALIALNSHCFDPADCFLLAIREVLRTK